MLFRNFVSANKNANCTDLQENDNLSSGIFSFAANDSIDERLLNRDWHVRTFTRNESTMWAT